MDFMEWTKELSNVKGDRIANGVFRILENSGEMRPSFSYTWIESSVPTDAIKVDEYEINENTVKLFHLPNSTEDLYQINPPEYEMNKREAELIYHVKQSLSEQYPKDMNISDPEQVRDYVLSYGRNLIDKTAEKLGLTLGNTREERVERIEELSYILAKYTAGYGILEIFLSDSNVEDIYVDAPSEYNNLYLEIKGIKKIRDKCRTNVLFSKRDMDSILSRFRSESGKPFSEAFPVLEADLKEYDTRVTVIGKPLSPDGTAFALRRRDTEPWTLPRLIKVGSLTPTAAGVLSFFIDGKSTILIAGSRGAGKTTLLGALMLEFPKSQRILSIEDTRELPTKEMQELDYNIQSMIVGSSLEKRGLTANDALKVSLRLGESALIQGEVRGEEARTLYEAMRAGTAGSSVMGTIHGNSPQAVYDRVVHDIGISKESFSATDIIVIAGMVRPGGIQNRKRMITHISEYDHGDFLDLFNYDGGLNPTDHLKRKSEKIGDIARSWGLTYEEAIKNIEIRAYIKKTMVEFSREKGDSLLSPIWVAETNNKFWNLIEKYHDKGSYEDIKREWTEWYKKRIKYE
ncbi:MAG: ATPase, T2SS/T4P/T4SS family [Thermoplasmatota archaeon]